MTYVLGVDGLPLGRVAAVAVDGAIHSTFALPSSNARSGGLSQRVQAAVSEAQTLVGSLPAEVRLVCIDDGGDGSEVALAADWLATRGVGFQVLDLVGAEGPVPPPSQTEAAQQARSASRACDAALW